MQPEIRVRRFSSRACAVTLYFEGMWAGGAAAGGAGCGTKKTQKRRRRREAKEQREARQQAHHIVALPPCASTLALMAAKLVDGTAP